MPKDLIIIGAGGHGKVAADCAELMECFASIRFADEVYPSRQKNAHWDICMHPDDVDVGAAKKTLFFVAIGHNASRQKVMQELQQKGLNFATLIHPSAVISQYSQIGEGSLVCANAVVNCASSVGLGCIVNTASSIDHDCQIADYVHVAPGVRLAGAVTIGTGSFVGIGSVVLPGRSIGKNAILGAGSTLLDNISDFSVAVGSPARVIKNNNN